MSISEEQIRQLIRDELSNLILTDRYTFQKSLQIFDGRNIQLGRTNGTQIATETDQKLAFWGATPVDRPASVNDPTGGVTQDAQARTAISTLIDRLEELGLITPA